MNDPFGLLDPQFLKQVGALRIVARRVAPAGRWAEHRSRDRGAGLEFQDYRPYSPGDELRSVDWNIYRRLGRVVIRLFEEMEDLPIYLLPDLSRSMWLETDSPRAIAAMRACIGLAAIALDQHDRVALMPFGESLDVAVRPTSGHNRLPIVAQSLSRVGIAARDEKRGTDLASSLATFRGLGMRQGLAVIVSDFLDPRGVDVILNELKRLRHRPLLVGIQRPEDRDPTLQGDVRVRDCETGDVHDVSITTDVVRRYREAYDDHFQRLHDFARQRQGAWLTIDPNGSVMNQLASLFERGRFIA